MVSGKVRSFGLMCLFSFVSGIVKFARPKRLQVLIPLMVGTGMEP